MNPMHYTWTAKVQIWTVPFRIWLLGTQERGGHLIGTCYLDFGLSELHICSSLSWCHCDCVPQELTITMLPCCQIGSVCQLALLRIAGNCRQFAWPRPGLNHRTRAPATAETGSWPRQCLPPEQMPWTNLYSSWVLKNMFEYRKHLSKYISSKVD